MGLTITSLVRKAHSMARAKGFWEGDRAERAAELGVALLLVHSEVSEAAECLRCGQDTTIISEAGKPEGFPSELADIVIRVADLAGAAGIELEREIRRKMSHNATRQLRHGKRF